MKHFCFYKIIIVTLIAVSSLSFKSDSCRKDTIVYQKEDLQILKKIVADFKPDHRDKVATLVALIGKSLIGTPYVSHTLDSLPGEPLVVNLHQVDCTTFAEYCLAAAKMISRGDSTMNDFACQLEKIRYRNGKREGYTSRLHYFSDWIRDNARKGIIREPAERFGVPYSVSVSFMSSHPGSYQQLRNDSAAIAKIRTIEHQISSRHYYYLPKAQLSAKESFLHEGDIAGLVTTIKGLDIAHVGILVWGKDRHFHLLNASSLHHRVIITKEPLLEQLNHHKTYRGIMIARPL